MIVCVRFLFTTCLIHASHLLYTEYGVVLNLNTPLLAASEEVTLQSPVSVYPNHRYAITMTAQTNTTTRTLMGANNANSGQCALTTVNQAPYHGFVVPMSLVTSYGSSDFFVQLNGALGPSTMQPHDWLLLANLCDRPIPLKNLFTPARFRADRETQAFITNIQEEVRAGLTTDVVKKQQEIEAAKKSKEKQIEAVTEEVKEPPSLTEQQEEVVTEQPSTEPVRKRVKTDGL